MRALMSEIASGERVEGDMLPRESDLAEQFDVSRGVAREVIRGLEERGLVKVRHGKGAFVTPSAHWNMFDPDVLGAMLESSRSAEVLAEHLEFRRIVEVEAAGLAAERADDDHIERMTEALSRMEASAARPPTAAAERQFHEADLAFHEALIAATGNRALVNVAQGIHAALLAARFPLARPQHRAERALPEHRRILAAVVDRDRAGARLAMSDHLATVEEYLRVHSERGADRPIPAP